MTEVAVGDARAAQVWLELPAAKAVALEPPVTATGWTIRRGTMAKLAGVVGTPATDGLLGEKLPLLQASPASPVGRSRLPSRSCSHSAKSLGGWTISASGLRTRRATSFGHPVTHSPHPMQRLRSTTENPSPSEMAPTWSGVVLAPRRFPIPGRSPASQQRRHSTRPLW